MEGSGYALTGAFKSPVKNFLISVDATIWSGVTIKSSVHSPDARTGRWSRSSQTYCSRCPSLRGAPHRLAGRRPPPPPPQHERDRSPRRRSSQTLCRQISGQGGKGARVQRGRDHVTVVSCCFPMHTVQHVNIRSPPHTCRAPCQKNVSSSAACLAAICAMTCTRGTSPLLEDQGPPCDVGCKDV